MPSLKDLRNRIASVKATQKITKAMQMVAAAKLRRAQSAAEAARPFSERMEKVLANIAGGIDKDQGGPPLLVGTGNDATHLLVVCTGERGLAGAFNTAIVRLARERANRLMAEGKTVKIFTVGKKGYDQLRRQFEKNIVERTDLRGVRTPGFEQAEGIAKKILELFEKGEFDVCTLFYSAFKSVISQVPTAQQLIPLDIPVPEEKKEKGKEEQVFYDYEPDEDEILSSLLPRNIAIQILKALLENQASFFGAQMSAMDSATRNAGDMIKAQTLKYNRTRQAMITKELIEIISGAEAL